MNLTNYAKRCCQEPFRIFFPVGLLTGMIGVLLWPLFNLGVVATYPATAHARLMVEGFLSCFIFGFLGTAGPRVLSVQHFSGAEVVRLVGVICAAVTAHLLAAHALGDTLFLAALLLFARSLLGRFRQREDSPPPNFALVGLGILNGIAGAALLAFCEWSNSAPSGYRLGTSLLNVGFVLLPVIGVAPFFIRRLLDLPGDDDVVSTSRWSLVSAIAVGLTIDASFFLELYSSNHAIGWIRCGVAVGFLLMTMPYRGRNTLATFLRMSLAAIAAGLALMTVLPAYRISALHVVFIGGFAVTILSVATRVVLGHSGKLHQLQKRRWFFVSAFLLLILAMVSRFLADFVPTRNEHLIGAAISWLMAAALWSVLVLPYVTATESEDSRRPSLRSPPA